MGSKLKGMERTWSKFFFLNNVTLEHPRSNLHKFRNYASLIFFILIRSKTEMANSHPSILADFLNSYQFDNFSFSETLGLNPVSSAYQSLAPI